MDIAEIISLAGLLVVAVGLGATWRKNGKSQAQKYGQLEKKVDNVSDKIDSLTNKVFRMDDNVNTMKEHCASVTSGYHERLKTLEREMGEVRKK